LPADCVSGRGQEAAGGVWSFAGVQYGRRRGDVVWDEANPLFMKSGLDAGYSFDL
jgi:hypothetical protein